VSNRTLRVNELIQRELSDILRKRYQAEAVALTITGVQTAPDLRDARVYVSVMGDADAAEKGLRWLGKHQQDLRFELGRRITLKYLPQFTFTLDKSTARGNRILQMLDEVEAQHGDQSDQAGPADVDPSPREKKPERE
jgi:ribosome-binding factor A